MSDLGKKITNKVTDKVADTVNDQVVGVMTKLVDELRGGVNNLSMQEDHKSRVFWHLGYKDGLDGRLPRLPHGNDANVASYLEGYVAGENKRFLRKISIAATVGLTVGAVGASIWFFSRRK